jgi:hypothetical protein
MITVLTWLWAQPDGRTKYTAEHVNIWADMVDRHLAMDHEIACVTNMPEGIDDRVRIITPPGDFEDVRIPTWGEARAKGLPQCFRRIAMFRPDAANIFGKRFVSMDLDCVISGSLDPLFDRPEDFVMYRGTTADRPYNGSMLMLTAGSRPHVYNDFTPEKAVIAGQQYLGSDQAWISYALGWGEATWSVPEGVQAWGSRQNIGWPSPVVTFFLSAVKPWDLAGNDWIDLHYRRNDEWDLLEIEHRMTAVGGERQSA